MFLILFKCQSISAVHLAEDLKLQRNGKFVQQHRDPMIPPHNHHQNSQQHHSNNRQYTHLIYTRIISE